jgi:hypothetical protein
MREVFYVAFDYSADPLFGGGGGYYGYRSGYYGGGGMMR